MSSTMREVTSISLEFQTSSRVQLSCGDVPGCSVDGSAVTLDVRALFADWFANNTALGSLGLLRLPLGVDSSLQGTVTVRVRNSLGASNAQVFPLP
jgi:predicted RNase H-like nuclease